MTDNTVTQSLEEFDWFKNNGIFMPMINDTGRNVFYKQAIEENVRGKTVVDIGTGTGFLSVLAAKAGAEKVYAVEMDPGRARYAREMIRSVGLDNIIEVINDNFYNTRIPADIYVSETIGTPIFNEYIIPIAEHARQFGGMFIPGKFEIWATAFADHPIFPIVEVESNAFEFQPDIAIDPVFENKINEAFQQQHPLETTLYRANHIEKFFTMLPRFKDLKLTELYKTEPITVDLNGPVDVNDIRLRIPSSVTHLSGMCVVIFWRAITGNVVMNVTDTWWGNPSKMVLTRTRKPNTDITMWYDPVIHDWRFAF
jgi:predicted RNA methylase